MTFVTGMRAGAAPSIIYELMCVAARSQAHADIARAGPPGDHIALAQRQCKSQK